MRLAEIVDVEHAADVVATPLGLEDLVVALSAYVLAAEEKFFVALALFCDAVRGVLPAPLGVKAAETILETIKLFIVHVVVEQHLLVLELTRDLYPGALGERHVEKAVEGLAVLRAHLQGCRNEVPRAGVADAEEITYWHEHARLFLSIPVHLEEQPAQEVGLDGLRAPVHVLIGDGDPDVVYGARGIYFGQGRTRSGLYGEAVVVAAGAVPAGGSLSAARPQPR